METKWTVDVLAYNGTTRNEYGNVVPSWVTVPVAVPVYGWFPATITEETATRNTVTSDIELLVPPGFTIGPKDHVRINGVTYEVNGGVEDYSHGPFGFNPGGKVNLKAFVPS